MKIEEFVGELPKGRGKRDSEETTLVKMALKTSAATSKPQVIKDLDEEAVSNMVIRVRNSAKSLGLDVSVYRRPEAGEVIFLAKDGSNDNSNDTTPTPVEEPKVKSLPARRTTRKKTAHK